eukprot:gene4316-5040_t
MGDYEDDDDIFVDNGDNLVHSFAGDSLDEGVFKHLPQDIQIEVLNQLRHEKLVKDKISLLTPPKNPNDFSQHQIGSILEKGKISRQISQVKDSMSTDLKGVSSDGETVFIYQKTAPSPSATPNKAPSSLSEKIAAAAQKKNQAKATPSPLSSTTTTPQSSTTKSTTPASKQKSSLHTSPYHNQFGDMINRRTFTEPRAASGNKTIDQHVLNIDKSASRNLLDDLFLELDNDILRECHELLALFGIPFITSPTEAEAQCAELHNIGLVDGVVTDDSDILLFGNQDLVVYRRMFQRAERYTMPEITAKLGLDRQNLIDMAILLGCDYTTGIKGIGIVKAVEVISEFDTLEQFKSFMKGTLPKDDENDHSSMKSLIKKVTLPDSFPSDHVKMAFYEPDVNRSKERFAWKCPDLNALRNLTRDKFDWEQSKTLYTSKV